MDVKSFSRNHKHQIWIERILACKASGLPVKTWCKQNGIAYSSYYHWLRETRQDLLDMHEVAAGNPESSSIVESPLSLTPITFHELPVVSEVVPEQEGAISLVLPGLSLHVDVDASSKHIRAAITVLRSLCC